MTIRKIGNIEYEFTRKHVKNINLRVHTDGRVTVSAPNYVPLYKVDEFVLSKADFIGSARVKLASIEPRSGILKEKADEYTDEECLRFFTALIDKYYGEFKCYGIPYPKLRIKNMKSRWGSCIPSKGVITLNRQLIALPVEFAEYVTVHEYCHFLEQNHSAHFYAHVERHMSDWRERRKALNSYKPLA